MWGSTCFGICCARLDTAAVFVSPPDVRGALLYIYLPRNNMGVPFGLAFCLISPPHAFLASISSSYVRDYHRLHMPHCRCTCVLAAQRQSGFSLRSLACIVGFITTHGSCSVFPEIIRETLFLIY